MFFKAGTARTRQTADPFKKNIKKMSHDDDPYAVLGLTPPCTPRTLRRTYLQRARRVHPDKHPDDPNATHEFQRLSHAYHVLQTAHDAPPTDSHDTIDIQQYKAMYETLSARA